jgi:hypothetical protein
MAFFITQPPGLVKQIKRQSFSDFALFKTASLCYILHNSPALAGRLTRISQTRAQDRSARRRLNKERDKQAFSARRLRNLMAAAKVPPGTRRRHITVEAAVP